MVIALTHKHFLLVFLGVLTFHCLKVTYAYSYMRISGKSSLINNNLLPLLWLHFVYILYSDFISILEVMLVSIYISYIVLPEVYWGNMIPKLTSTLCCSWKHYQEQQGFSFKLFRYEMPEGLSDLRYYIYRCITLMLLLSAIIAL